MAANLLNQQISGSMRRKAFNLNSTLTPDMVADLKTDTGASTPNSDSAQTAQLLASPQEPVIRSDASTSKRKLRQTDAAKPAGQDSPAAERKRVRAYKATTNGKQKAHDPPATRLRDLGGVTTAIEQILELVAMPLCHPEIYLHTGVRPPTGVLLCGPPGCGKTMLAGAIAGELGVPFLNISAPSVVSGMSGESERAIRDTFEEAASLAPCILFIDEIDAITPKRENAAREMERRIVAQLLTCMDDLSWEKTDNKPVLIIGATNRPDSLDTALRRAGRFDHEIVMGVPDENARKQILRVVSSKLRLAGDFDFRALAKSTPGYVGADLEALAGAAGIIAVKRIFEDLKATSGHVNGDSMLVDAQTSSGDATEIITGPFTSMPPSLQLLAISAFLQAHPEPLTDSQLEPLHISHADFQQALLQVQPSSKREGFTTVPDVSWSDVGALSEIREELKMAIVQPIKRPELFASLGIATPCGVLLWGPPGCGKTLLAKAVANESAANFISVRGPELLNKYVGESERAVRQVFARARASSPCVVFFDELDALVPRRDDNLSESSARVVNTLLTELDGLEPRKQVFVVGATNRPDMIDPAMVRPGRLDKLLYVDLPTPAEREDIIRAQSTKTPFASDVDLAAVAVDARCDGFSGADLSALVREACSLALREVLKLPLASQTDLQVLVRAAHLDEALDKVSPSVSVAQRKRYAQLRTMAAAKLYASATKALSGEKPFSAVSDWIERLCSERYEIEEYDGIPELVESINLQSTGPTEASRAIRKKLKYGNVHRQLRSLTILKALVENCGTRFQTTFANERLVDRLKVMVGDPMTDDTVKRKLMSVLASWHRSFKGDPSMHLVAGLWEACGGNQAAKRNAASKAYAEQQARAEEEARLRQQLKASERSDKEQAKLRAKEQKDRLKLRNTKGKRIMFDFEKEKPNIMQAVAQASQASNNLVNALQHVNRERETLSANAKVQTYLEKAKTSRKAIVRYTQLIETDVEGEYVGMLLKTNEQIIAALQLYDRMNKPVDLDSDDEDVQDAANRIRSAGPNIAATRPDLLRSFSALTVDTEVDKIQERQRFEIERANRLRRAHPDLEDLVFDDGDAAGLQDPMRPSKTGPESSYGQGSLSDYSDYDSSEGSVHSQDDAPQASSSHRAYEAYEGQRGNSLLEDHDDQDQVQEDDDDEDDPFADPTDSHKRLDFASV
ncbi:hypothetical protein E5Q_03969 [Mixia osmundae IAM 14324]|uniref:VHS domain-containing protein n=1 Tax=Mixia osmundae (strain CBS 9802 / IAM 14324 / JCM 22182 / KY 12970) TaxID=764103 RepID=G7E2U7_MIXOS|nr:hypothetical protein E5Q_03969 [Mixia osmundae IAM 14324]